MEAGGDEGFKKKEKSSERGQKHQRTTYGISNRMKETLFAIVVTVAAAFAVKGIEMMVTNAGESLSNTKQVYAG